MSEKHECEYMAVLDAVINDILNNAKSLEDARTMANNAKITRDEINK